MCQKIILMDCVVYQQFPDHIKVPRSSPPEVSRVTVFLTRQSGAPRNLPYETWVNLACSWPGGLRGENLHNGAIGAAPRASRTGPGPPGPPPGPPGAPPGPLLG